MDRRRYRDPDTGLFNTAMWRRCWRRLVRRARRTRSPMAVVTLAIEGDEHVDDEVLRDVVDAVVDCGDPRAMAFRTGPTKVAVLIPDVDLSLAGEICERMRQRAHDCLSAAALTGARARAWLSIYGGVRAPAA